MKKTGGCHLETLLELARAAGISAFDIIQQRQPSPRSPAIELVAKKLSAGRPSEISPKALLKALKSRRLAPEMEVPLRGFFEELPIELVHDVALEEGLNYQGLWGYARLLDVEGDMLAWLQEMAGDGLAQSA